MKLSSRLVRSLAVFALVATAAQSIEGCMDPALAARILAQNTLYYSNAAAGRYNPSYYGYNQSYFSGGQYYAGGQWAGVNYPAGYYRRDAPFIAAYNGLTVAPAAGYTAPVMTPQTSVGPIQPVYAPQTVTVGQPVQGYVTPDTAPGMMTVPVPADGRIHGIVNGQWTGPCRSDAWRAPCTPVVGSNPVDIAIPGQVPGMPYGQPVYQQPGYGYGVPPGGYYPR